MVTLVYSPRWFYGIDIIIDFFSILILFLIGYFSYQCYRLNKERKEHFLFSVSFFILAISFLFKILTNFSFYTNIWRAQSVGQLTFLYQTAIYSETLFLVGTIISRLLVLFGFYLLYSLYYKNQIKSNIFFIVYLIFIITYFSSPSYYIFHFTNLLFLSFIIHKIYNNYKITRDLPAKFILYSFLIIALSQLLFIFLKLHELCYVFAELVQLLGYILLLISFILVLHYGKKKKLY